MSKIVRFGNGKYALRKWNLGHIYKDLTLGLPLMWRGRANYHFDDCLANSVEELKERLMRQKEEQARQRADRMETVVKDIPSDGDTLFDWLYRHI